MSWKRTSPIRRPGMVSSHPFRTSPLPRKDVFTVDNLCDKIQSMENGLTTTERSVKDFSLRKKELERLLASTTAEVRKLEGELSVMRGQEFEWKIKEDMLNQDIKRMTNELEEIKRTEEETQLQDKEEELKGDTAVASFEKNCLVIARRLKLLIPEDMGKAAKENVEEKIKNFEDEIENLEEEIEKLSQERESKSLPVEEMKFLLKMANKENANIQ